MESFDIAQWADAHSQRGDGANLFPAGQLEALKRYHYSCCRLSGALDSSGPDQRLTYQELEKILQGVDITDVHLSEPRKGS